MNGNYGDPLMAAWGMAPAQADPQPAPKPAAPTNGNGPRSGLYGKSADEIASLFWRERPGRPDRLFLTRNQVQALYRQYESEGRKRSGASDDMFGTLMAEDGTPVGRWGCSFEPNGAGRFVTDTRPIAAAVGKAQSLPGVSAPTPAGTWNQPAQVSNFNGWGRLSNARSGGTAVATRQPVVAPTVVQPDQDQDVAAAFRAAMAAPTTDRATAQTLVDNGAKIPTEGSIMPDLLKLKAESDTRDAAADAAIDAFLASAPAKESLDMANAYGSAITAPVAAALKDNWDAQVALGQVAMILADCGLDAETKVARMKVALRF